MDEHEPVALTLGAVRASLRVVAQLEVDVELARQGTPRPERRALLRTLSERELIGVRSPTSSCSGCSTVAPAPPTSRTGRSVPGVGASPQTPSFLRWRPSRSALAASDDAALASCEGCYRLEELPCGFALRRARRSEPAASPSPGKSRPAVTQGAVPGRRHPGSDAPSHAVSPASGTPRTLGYSLRDRFRPPFCAPVTSPTSGRLQHWLNVASRHFCFSTFIWTWCSRTPGVVSSQSPPGRICP